MWIISDRLKTLIEVLPAQLDGLLRIYLLTFFSFDMHPMVVVPVALNPVVIARCFLVVIRRLLGILSRFLDYSIEHFLRLCQCHG